jgi:hypothetical protein
LTITDEKSMIRSQIRFPLVRGTDPRIPISTKMSGIRNTGKLVTCSLLLRFVSQLKTDVGSKFADVGHVAKEELNTILERYEQ